MSSTSDRVLPPLRAISVAWGEKYVHDLLEVCIPALLAPGNLPALTGNFAVEVVLVTERRFFELVRRHPSVIALTALCSVELKPVDDLLATKDSYGMSLTYALFRGFEELGPRMTDYVLLFINADFVLADGSYRNLLPHLLKGERLVLSPSYCVIEEEVRPKLDQARGGNAVLAISNRAMADLVLRHRHFTIRSKVLNQRFYSLKQIDQVYWAVDESTLAGRQLPIAVVAMKPERQLSDMVSYWDYGAIAEFCPSLKHVVLGDSDDFLMMELRSRETAKLDLRFGWPEPAEIAQGMTGFTTDYCKHVGRGRLVLHTGDLPPATEQAQRSLDEYLDRIYAHLPSIPHQGHFQWVYHYDRFHRLRRQRAERPLDESGTGPEDANNSLEVSADTVTRGQEPALREALADLRRAAQASTGMHAPLSQLIHTFADLVDKGLAAGISYRGLIEKMDQMPSRSDGVNTSALQAAYSAFEASAESETRFLEAVYLDQLRHSRYEMRQLLRGAVALRAHHANPGGKPTPQENLALATRISKAFFGAQPRYRPWHWLRPSTRLAYLSARTEPGAAGRTLVLESLGMFEHVKQARSAIAIPVVLARYLGFFGRSLQLDGTFQHCLVEGDFEDFGGFRSLFQTVRPVLSPGGKLTAFFVNAGRQKFPAAELGLLQHAFPLCGPARIAYSGSWAAHIALQLRHRLPGWIMRHAKLPSPLAVSLAMLAAAPFALLASIIESRRSLENSYNPPRFVTAVTIEIDIG
jgi:hypothetical protein